MKKSEKGIDAESIEPPPKRRGKGRWSDWRWQLSNRITTVEQLIPLTGPQHADENRIRSVTGVFPMAVTPYYASLIDWKDQSCPIRAQCIPDEREMICSCEEMEDPLKEEQYSPLSALIHRYPDRVLLLVTLECSTYCRHCTRKRKVGDVNRAISIEDIRKGIEYIRNHSEIRDVLLSGGDPLMLKDEVLESIISSIRQIPHVEVIRIGTRMPVVLPQRITASLVKMLKKYHPLWINTHFNHPAEFTPESTKALARIVNAGIPMGNQTVLLKGVNDSPEIMKELLHQLVKNRVRPYYLYHCDYSRGIQHFRTTIQKGIEILEKLIGFTSGFSIPTYVVDIAGGGGKVPLLPNYRLQSMGTHTVLRNFEGTEFNVEETDK